MKDKQEDKDFSSKYLWWDAKRLMYRPVQEKEERIKLENRVREEMVLYETHSDYRFEKEKEIFSHPKILLPEDVCYVETIASLDPKCVKSRIHRSRGDSMYSIESTKTLMKRWFTYNKVSYDSVRLMGKYIGITQNCPYVVGNHLYIPERGSSRGTTSWIALHHMSHYEAHSKGVSLFFPDCGEIISPLSHKSFEKQLERAATLFYLQTLAFQSLISHFSFTLNVVQDKQNILVHEWLRKNSAKLAVYDLEEAVTIFYAMKLSKRLRGMMGEGNPLADELLVELDPWLHPFKWLGF